MLGVNPQDPGGPGVWNQDVQSDSWCSVTPAGSRHPPSLGVRGGCRKPSRAPHIPKGDQCSPRGDCGGDTKSLPLSLSEEGSNTHLLLQLLHGLSSKCERGLDSFLIPLLRTSGVLGELESGTGTVWIHPWL